MQLLALRSLSAACILVLAVAPVPGVAKNKPVTAKDEIEFGVKMAQQGLWAEALFRFQQAERMGASSAAVYNNMAVAYEALGVFDKARENYQRALSVSRDSDSLRRNYSRFVEFYQSFSPEGEEGEEASDEAAQDDPGEEPTATADPASAS